MTKKPVTNAGAIVLALLISGCASDTRSGQGKGSQSTRPSQEAPAERQDQRQEEQRKQDLQQHEMERGELQTTKPLLTKLALPASNYDASFSLLGTSKT